MVGLAITVAPVVVFNAVAGDHVYVFAPLATNATEPPAQIEGVAGLTVMVGVGLTVKERVLVLVQVPFAPVTV